MHFWTKYVKMERFEKFIKIILKNECGRGNGYVNDKDDKGGETIYGITRRNHADLTIWSSLDQLSTLKEKRAYKPNKEEMEEVYEVYRRQYYNKLQCDYFDCENLALQLFDFGVNAGISRSARMLQNILHINEDGIVGLQTVTTANLKKCSEILDMFKTKRKEYYVKISKKGNNQKFLKGWLNRIEKTFV